MFANVACYADILGNVSYSHKHAKGSSPHAVAVLNGVGFHTEVYCALVWSFRRAGMLPKAYVLKDTTSGIEDVMSDWYAPVTPVRHLPSPWQSSGLMRWCDTCTLQQTAMLLL